MEITRQYTKDEKFAILHNLKHLVDAEYEAMKEEMKGEVLELESVYSVANRDIKVNGIKVGRVGIRRSKPKVKILAGCEREAIDLLHSMGLTEERPVKGWEDYFDVDGGIVFNEGGEICPQLTFIAGGKVTAAVSMSKPQAISDALGGFEDMSIKQLIGGVE